MLLRHLQSFSGAEAKEAGWYPLPLRWLSDPPDPSQAGSPIFKNACPGSWPHMFPISDFAELHVGLGERAWDGIEWLKCHEKKTNNTRSCSLLAQQNKMCRGVDIMLIIVKQRRRIGYNKANP